MFGNLLRIVTAPLEILDELVVKPVADLADDVVDGFKSE
jgi:hypothetical protein